MNKFDRYALWYLVGASPFFVIFLIWVSFFVEANKRATMNGGIWNVVAIFFIPWILDIFYIVIKMLFSKKLRDNVMAKLAGMKERDERESNVAGNAAKFSFLSTFAIVLFFIVFSMTTFSVTKHPKDTNGNRGMFSIGFDANVIDKTAVTMKTVGDAEVYSYNSLPLTKPFILFFILLWQLGSYHLIARRELKE